MDKHWNIIELHENLFIFLLHFCVGA